MPETVAAPVAAAAPVSTPSAAPATTATPSTPAPASAPATTETTPTTTTTETTPTTATETPATETQTATAGAEPKREDFGDDIEGFLKAHNEWESKQQEGGEQTPTETPAEPTTEEQQTQATTEEPKYLDEPEESLNPESLHNKITQAPEVKAALEKYPKLNGEINRMARENAAWKPIAEMFSSVEGAKEVVSNADRYSGMRQAFTLAGEDPSRIGDAFNMFIDEFKVVDDKGNPVFEADGKTPKLSEDYEVLANYMLDNYLEGEMLDIEDRIKGNQFTNETERETAESVIQAIKFLRDWKNASTGDRTQPNLEELSPEVRKHFEAREAEIRRKEEELGIRKTEQAKDSRKQARQQFENKVAVSFAGSIGKKLDSIIKEKTEAGVHIPSYVLQTQDPQLKVSVFAKSILDKFRQKLDSMPDVKNRFRQLEAMPPSDRAYQERETFGSQLVEKFLPGIVDAELRLIQGKDRSDRAARAQKANAARNTVEPDVRGGPPRATSMSEEDAMKEAYRRVDHQYGEGGLDPADRMVKALLEKNRIMGRSA